MQTIQRGSGVLIETEIMSKEAFKDYQFSDLTDIAIKVYDPENNKKDEGSMTKVDTGRYYYTIQTETDWLVGDYSVEVSGTKDEINIIEKNESVFKLD